MAVGAFKIVGQDGSIAPALPMVLGVSSAQVALAAGGEAAPVLTLSRPITVTGTQLDWAFLTAVLVGTEANVMYVAQVNTQVAGTYTTLTLKVRNVGTVGGTQAWVAMLVGVPVGVA